MVIACLYGQAALRDGRDREKNGIPIVTIIASTWAFKDMSFRQKYFSYLIQRPIEWRVHNFLTPVDLAACVCYYRKRGLPFFLALWRSEPQQLLRWFDFSDITLIHIDDENAEYAGPIYHSVRRVLRNYLAPEMFGAHYFPLGFSDLRGNVVTNEVRERENGFYFAGSHSTGTHRYELVILWQRLAPVYNIEAHFFSTFNSNGISKREYYASMRKFRFCLVPCGENTETYRLWEALVSKCIPIVESCDSLFVSFLQLNLSTTLPFVVDNNENDWGSVIARAYSSHPGGTSSPSVWSMLDRHFVPLFRLHG